MTDEHSVGVLGASSFVGGCLLPSLAASGCKAIAFSRKTKAGVVASAVDWRKLPDAADGKADQACSMAHLISVAPIWALPELFPQLETLGVQKIVALSSTSRYTKEQSSDAQERQLAQQFAQSERRLQSWAEQRGIEWVILRPTLIYGLGQDKNISEIARLIRRLGFFPIFGKADGLRQPIYVGDVAGACVAALQNPEVRNRAFNISGAETLTYRDMVTRIFAAMGRRPRLLTVPLWTFRLALALVRRVSFGRQWNAAIAERMNHDLVFDHAEASQAFGFKPRGFVVSLGDLP